MKTLFISLVVSLFSISFTFANVLGPANDKNSKLIKLVNNAEKNDWCTLNRAASLSINWNADLELAKQWLEASIKINDNAEAYEILGDYHLRKGDVQEAYKCYFQSLEKGLFTLSKEDMDRVQRKVLRFSKAL